MSKLSDLIKQATAVIIVKEGGARKMLPRTQQMAIVNALIVEWQVKHGHHAALDESSSKEKL